MTQEQFEAACAVAIKEWYDPKLDGPLLIATRQQTGYSLKLGTWEEPFPEFASAIGEWPRAGYHSDYYGDFTQFNSQSIEGLVRHSKELWQIRQEEPDEVAPYREGLVWIVLPRFKRNTP